MKRFRARLFNKKEIETSPRLGMVPGYVCNFEIALETTSRALNVMRIEVEPEVVRLVKMRSIGSRSAANVENKPDFAKIIVRKHRRKLAISERGLPEPVNERILEKRFGQAHCFHLTSKWPIVREFGNRWRNS